MTMPDHYTSVSELKMANLSSEKLLSFYEEMGFQDLSRRLTRRLFSSGSTNDDSTIPVTDVKEGSSGAKGTEKQIEGSASTIQKPVSSTISAIDEAANSSPSAALNESIRLGLLLHNQRRQAPPIPEDFIDVPF